MTNGFRIVMCGTGPFAVPTFRRLLKSPELSVAALVTQPPRKVHSRGRAAAGANPMRKVAEECGMPVLSPESINAPQACVELAGFAADLLVVCDYGQILSPQALASARLGGINLHASLLPKYRGAAPINWAIYYGEPETGVTVIHMTPQLDAGPCLAQRSTPIGADETTPELEARLAEIGAEVVVETIAALRENRVTSVPQSSALATKAPRLKKEDGGVDWSRSASDIRNQVRAFQPWPGTYTYLQRPGHEPLRLILDQVEVVSGPQAISAVIQPGVVLATAPQLLVGTSDGILSVVKLQPAGKRVLTAAEFLRGYPVPSGDRFGSLESEV